jgi:nucleotide-binding universal stress UspA family protein
MTALAFSNSREPSVRSVPAGAPEKAPIIVVIDRVTTSDAAARAAIELARTCNASLLFVYVRRRSSSIWGAPFYQRRLSRETRRARSALDRVLRLASDAGVEADAEIIEGPSRRRVVEFAAARGARLVIGSHRGRLVLSAAILRSPRDGARLRCRLRTAFESSGSTNRSAGPPDYASSPDRRR